MENKLHYVGNVISKITTVEKPQVVAENLGVTTALISTWKQKDNDFCPRVGVAAKILKHYKMVVYPYSELALKTWLQENDT